MKKRTSLFLLSFLLILSACNKQPKDKKTDDFYTHFQQPPAEARPFVRWWWNGNHIQADEIKRELDILKAAGIGGVEINPIAMPEDAKDIGTKPVEWLSEEWNKLLSFAANETQKRGMIADMIVGSGWPFGGEFLKPDEYAQKILIGNIAVKGKTSINEDISSLQQKFIEKNNWPKLGETYQTNLHFIALVPTTISSTSEIILLTDEFKKNNQLNYTVPEGDYELIYGIQQIGHRKVMHGALGADGYVMDHFNKQITMDYLNRLKKISEDTGIPLSELIRALFCDSIELAGANWTDNFDSIFKQTYGYDLKPFYPFIFYEEQKGYENNNYSPEFQEKIKRVRYDYNRLLVDVFLDNFTRSFQEFCTENGLKCRYQAYGTPFLMGMLEGYMIPDIPESNNWIYSAEMDAPLWKWSKGHGYMIWNHYAAAGGHLMNRKIISCESMTNTKGVFRTSLEEIKQHDDMNFISGINHSVLHGFNYSPPEAGFPGWIRYGSYFSEHNTWWPYFSHWTDYNARLSYVFQNSQAQKNIAILPPTGDLWGNTGLSRTPFHYSPWYIYDLWETFSQSGTSCEYINEKVLQKAEKKDNKLIFGPMQYKALMLCGVKSLQPETAVAIEKYVKNGGKLILIDSIPYQSLSFKDAEKNDKIVADIFKKLQKEHSAQLTIIESPEQGSNVLKWTENLINQSGIEKDVKMSIADPGLYQIYQKKDQKDIFFFTNTYRAKSLDYEAEFDCENKTPWIWNPETGERNVFPYENTSTKLNIQLDPLESLLIVFEPGKQAPGKDGYKVDTTAYSAIGDTWIVSLKDIDNNTFEYKWQNLPEFTSTGDTVLHNFAGTVVYQTTFTAKDNYSVLRLGQVNEGITEVYVNDEKAGEKWYGIHEYDLSPYLKKGENNLKIIYTTMLANRCMSLKNNPTAQRWTKGFQPLKTGIEGPVRLYKKKKE